jgi:S-adenosylmethionine synthetase
MANNVRSRTQSIYTQIPEHIDLVELKKQIIDIEGRLSTLKNINRTDIENKNINKIGYLTVELETLKLILKKTGISASIVEVSPEISDKDNGL